jgi:hypothetical protein
VYARPAEGGGGAFKAVGITVLCMRGGLIAQVTRFSGAHLFPRFGLPESLPDDTLGTPA